MKILIVGAGAVGGYFGGRLAQKGEDVTFLIRERRRNQLRERGLVIHSVNGDAVIEPKLLVSGEESQVFDMIVLTPKAYHLEECIRDIAPYVGEKTMLLPLLNGIQHMSRLWEAFGEERVLGGLCFIESTLDANGDIKQTSPGHRLAYGEWNGQRTTRMEALEQVFEGAKATFVLSENIQQEMWHKYMFIAAMSGMTTLMNSAVGPIREARDGKQLTRQLFEEIASIMRAEGAPIADDIVDKQMMTFEKQGYHTKSSMLRDMEKGLSVEADHLQGYLLELARRQGIQAPLLSIIYNNLKVYEIKQTK